MPANKNRKAKRKGGKGVRDEEKGPLILAEDGQVYAQATKVLGDRKIECACSDGKTRIGKIRGRVRTRISLGDLLLVSLRGYQDGHADIFLRFTSDQARRLKAMGELPDTVELSAGFAGTEKEEDCGIDFDAI